MNQSSKLGESQFSTKTVRKPEVERLRTRSETKSRQTTTEVPKVDTLFEGEERIIANPNGTSDILKRVGDQIVRLSSTLHNAQVIEFNNAGSKAVGFQVEFNGRRYRVPLEEVK